MFDADEIIEKSMHNFMHGMVNYLNKYTVNPYTVQRGELYMVISRQNKGVYKSLLVVMLSQIREEETEGNRTYYYNISVIVGGNDRRLKQYSLGTMRIILVYEGVETYVLAVLGGEKILAEKMSYDSGEKLMKKILEKLYEIDSEVMKQVYLATVYNYMCRLRTWTVLAPYYIDEFSLVTENAWYENDKIMVEYNVYLELEKKLDWIIYSIKQGYIDKDTGLKLLEKIAYMDKDDKVYLGKLVLGMRFWIEDNNDVYGEIDIQLTKPVRDRVHETIKMTTLNIYDLDKMNETFHRNNKQIDRVIKKLVYRNINNLLLAGTGV